MGLDTAIDALLGNAPNILDPTCKIYGVVPAIVTAVNDPKQKRHTLGMVEVYFPWLQNQGDPNLIKPWARVLMMNAGKDVGFYAIPQIGDEVLVGFEHGDPAFPYVLGSLWNKEAGVPMPQAPKDKNDLKGFGKGAPTYKKHDFGPATLGGDKGANKTGFWRSRSGHMMIFDDNPGKVRMTDSSGASAIEQDGGTVDVTTSGDITMHATELISFQCVNFTLSAGQKIDMDTTDWGSKSDGTMKVKAGAAVNAEAKGDNCQIESDANINCGASSNLMAVGRNEMLVGA